MEHRWDTSEAFWATAPDLFPNSILTRSCAISGMKCLDCDKKFALIYICDAHRSNDWWEFPDDGDCCPNPPDADEFDCGDIPSSGG